MEPKAVTLSTSRKGLKRVAAFFVYLTGTPFPSSYMGPLVQAIAEGPFFLWSHGVRMAS